MGRRRLLSLVFALLAVGACRTSPARSAPSTADERGTVKVAGFDVPYVIEGTGRPCIVYSLLEYHRRAFSDRFKHELRCAFVQARFAIPGAPADPAHPFTVDAAVEDLEAVRSALGMSRFVLVGHSIQGTVALAYALRYPQHVSHVISIGSLPEVTEAFEVATGTYWDREATPERKAIDAEKRAALTKEVLATMTPSEAVVADIVADGAKRWYEPRFDERPLLSRDTFNAAVATQLFSSEYRLFRADEQVQPPTLLAVGRFDFVCPYTAWEPHRARFRDLTFVLFGRSGHTPQVEEAAAFDARVAAWLDRR